MTDFQMSLIAGGGVFLVAVIAYNKWQEHRARKTVEEVFTNDQDDVLMQGGGAAPAMSAAQGQAAARAVSPAAVPAAGGRREPTFDGSELHTDASPSLPADAGAHADGAMQYAPLLAEDEQGEPADAVIGGLVDPLIDCLIPLALEDRRRAATAILPTLQTLRHVGNKPIHYIGLHRQRRLGTGHAPAAQYTKLQAGVQMASRTTALNELEYSELVTRLRSLADEIGAEPDVPT
jgi:hypothetical protein